MPASGPRPGRVAGHPAHRIDELLPWNWRPRSGANRSVSRTCRGIPEWVKVLAGCLALIIGASAPTARYYTSVWEPSGTMILGEDQGREPQPDQSLCGTA